MYCTVLYHMYGLLHTSCNVLTVLYRMYVLLHTACNVLYSTVPYVRSVTHSM